MSEAAQAKVGGSDGFFSDVLHSVVSGVGEGLTYTGRVILPRYFAQELLDQRSDQLRDPTYDPTGWPRVPTPDTTATPPTATKTGLLFDNFTISGGGIIVAAVAVIGLFLVTRG